MDWSLPKIRLVDLAGIDHGLAVRLHDHWAQLMPHGGPRVIAQLMDHLISLGVAVEPVPASRSIYPEAISNLEADLLDTLSRAASPVAVDLLLSQADIWRRWLDTSKSDRDITVVQIIKQSEVLHHLIEPPTIVVVGQPNVGKSTLTNVMLDRSVSVVADLPGTTRDWVAGLAQLEPDEAIQPTNLHAAVTVRWIDTPGFRHCNDPAEGQAIELARSVIEQAHVLIALRDPVIDWPVLTEINRQPDLWVVNKVDCPITNTERGANTTGNSGADCDKKEGEGTKNDPLRISAKTGWGLNRAKRWVLDRLGLNLALSTARDIPWAFSSTLQWILTEGSEEQLRSYIHPG